MTADPRVTAARAFLAEAKQRKFADKPNSVLVREAAELRHQLSQVLKAIDAADETPRPRPRPRLDGSVGEASFVARDGSGILTPADVLTVISALADAGHYRRDCAEGDCTDCEASPADACEQHLDDLDQAAAYLAVAIRLEDQ